MNIGDHLVVHPEANTLIEQLLAAPPHASIMHGSRGIGKSHIAHALAMQWLGTVALENNPYYREVVPTKGTITIEQIRSLLRFFQLQVPGNATIKRTAVIVDADTMGTEAQNALLKLLEEPPEGSALLLTTSNLLGLLPTIRSRAQLYTLPDPATEQVISHFSARGLTEETVKKAALRHGTNIAAIEHALAGEVSSTDGALTQVKQALSGTTYQRLLLVDTLSKQKDQAVVFTDTLATVADASLRSAAAKDSKLDRWHHILEATNTAQEALERSGNTKLVLTELMLSL